MAQVERGLRKILSAPWVYDLFQRIMVTDRSRQRVVDEFIKPVAGQTVLDIGCGTATILNFLPDVNYFGVDLSPQYIEKARQRFGDRGQFQVATAADVILPADTMFDTVYAMGVLHHLDDDKVEQLFQMALRILAPGGRFISLDGTFIEHQHPISRFLIKHDRGLNIRTKEELLEIAGKYFRLTTAQIRSDLLRIPYTHLVLECVRDST